MYIGHFFKHFLTYKKSKLEYDEENDLPCFMYFNLSLFSNFIFKFCILILFSFN